MPERRMLASVRYGGWVPYYEERLDPVHAVAMEHALAFSLFEVVAWGMTITFAGVDVVTTSFGLSHPALTEAVPVSSMVIARYGWPGLAVQHVLILALLALLWQSLPRPYRVVVPLEGAWAGYIATHSNLVLLLTHGVLAPS